MRDWTRFDKKSREECKKCPRFKEGVFVKPQVVKKAKLAALAESPGQTEVEAASDGREVQVLVGMSGKLWDWILDRAGVERGKVSHVNTVMCGLEGKNVKPEIEEMRCCSGLVDEAIEGVETVIAMGAIATNRLIGLREVKDKKGKVRKKALAVTKWRGSVVEMEEGEIELGVVKRLTDEVRFKSGKRRGEMKPWKEEVRVKGKKRAVVVTLHPSELLRSGRKQEELVVADVKRAMRIGQGKEMVEVGGEIVTGVGARRLGEALSHVDSAVVDFETAGLMGRVLCVGVGLDEDNAIVVKPTWDVVEVLRKFFGKRENEFVAHNAVFDLGVMREKLRVEVKSKVFDTMHAAGYERPDIKARGGDKEGGWDEYLALDTVCSRMERLWYRNWKQEFREGDSKLEVYCGLDACHEAYLRDELKRRLRRDGRLERFEKVRMPLLLVLDRMEREGVRIDEERWKELTKMQERVLKKLESQWSKLARGVNYQSSKMLMEYFYDKLKLSPMKKRKTGNRTLEKDAIEKLVEKYPQVEALGVLAKIRHVRKKLGKDLNPRLIGKDGRAHFGYNLSGTYTGRLSGESQQFPRSGKGTDCVDGVEGCVCGRLRSVVVADDGDEGFGIGDFNQIEARLTAILSGERWLIDAFERDDFDYHQETGDVLGGAIDWIRKLDKKMRREYGKKGNHAMNYGMGVPGIMLHFKCDAEDAEEILRVMHKRRPRLRKWWKELEREIEESGGSLVTPYGFRLFYKWDERKGWELPKLAAGVPQSTAGDVSIDSMLEASRSRLKLRLVAHDEIGISARSEGEVKVLKNIMEMERDELGGWWCPASVGFGGSWEEAKMKS